MTGRTFTRADLLLKKRVQNVAASWRVPHRYRFLPSCRSPLTSSLLFFVSVICTALSLPLSLSLFLSCCSTLLLVRFLQTVLRTITVLLRLKALLRTRQHGITTKPHGLSSTFSLPFVSLFSFPFSIKLSISCFSRYCFLFVKKLDTFFCTARKFLRVCETTESITKHVSEFLCHVWSFG